MRKLLLLTLLIGLLAGSTQAKEDILTTAARAGSFKTLVSCVIAADLGDALKGKGHLTVFAPTDEAFSKLPEELRKELLSPAGKEKLASILKYHVLGRAISIPKSRPSHPLKQAKTLAGNQVNFKRESGEVFVNDSRVVSRNIACSNGIIHAIDEVLIPPVSYKKGGILDVASKAGNFKTLLAALKAAELEEALNGDGQLTVFAPTDEAFSALPEGTLASLLKPEGKEQLVRILKLHVLSGANEAAGLVGKGTAKTLSGEQVTASIRDGRIKINEANVLSNDIRTANGVVHAIDSVLLPEAGKSGIEKEVTIKADWRNPIKKSGIRAQRVTVSVSGGGRVELTDLEADEVVVTMAGGARLEIDGTAKRLEAKLAGGARLTANELRTGVTNATVSGGAIAGFNATDVLKVSVNAGARVKYVPTGAKIQKDVSKYATFEPYAKEMPTKLTASAEHSKKDHH